MHGFISFDFSAPDSARKLETVTPKQPRRATQGRVVSPFVAEMEDLYRKETSRIQHGFASGVEVLREQTGLIDSILGKLWEHCGLPGNGARVTLIAIGEFGRGLLFPYSEIDLLLFHAPEHTLAQFAEGTHRFGEMLSDLPLKTVLIEQILGDYSAPDSDHVETILSLLDCHHVAGDTELFADIRERLLPKRCPANRTPWWSASQNFRARAIAASATPCFTSSRTSKTGPAARPIMPWPCGWR